MKALSRGQSKQLSNDHNLDRELTDTELENIIGGGVLRGLPYYTMINTGNFGATKTDTYCRRIKSERQG